MTWSDLVCAYIVVVCLWGDRLLDWRDRMDAFDKAGGVFTRDGWRLTITPKVES